MKKALTALLGVSLLLVTPAAHAVTNPPLTADQQSQLDWNTVATSTMVAGPTVYDAGFDARSTTGCASKANEYDQKNNFGVTLFKVGFSLHTCWRGGNVVSKNWGAPWCWTGPFPDLWNCQNGDTYIEDQSNQNLPRPYIWRQYRFHLHMCVTWLCKDAWPWVYIGGRGDGTFGTNGGRG